MITITLQKIRDKSPCCDGWGNVLKAHEHLGMDTEFPLTSVLDSYGLNDTLWCFKCLPEYDYLWCKYKVWCARQVAHLMTDERSLSALDVAWRHADGLATDDELMTARDAARDAARAAEGAAEGAAAGATWAATRDTHTKEAENLWEAVEHKPA